MGNQVEKAFKEAGVQIGENLAENVNSALDAIENSLNTSQDTDDSVTMNEDSNTESIEIEKPNAAIQEMQNTLNEQSATIDRLVNIMGTMVTKFGAQQSDNSGENVNTTAFPQLSGNEANEIDIPLLENIKLG